jgi:uncharacterized RDD family membrane protein YckC
MNDGPRPPDPNDLTQPIPIVRRGPPPRRPGPAYGTVRQADRYDHRFGNVPAYLLARLAAFLVDVPGVAFVLATFGFNGYDRGMFAFGGHDRSGFETLALVALGAALLFGFLCEAIFGTTLGKLLFGLHTRRHDGKHAGLGRVFVRHLLRPLDVLVIGPFLALVTPRHQRAGDLAAGTVVGMSSLGLFAPLIGIALVAALGYAQVTYGGSLTSAVGVAAEIANYAPDSYAQFASFFGAAGGAGSIVKPFANTAQRASPQPTVAPTPAASTDATAAPAEDASPQASAPAADETPAAQDSAAITQQ